MRSILHDTIDQISSPVMLLALLEEAANTIDNEQENVDTRAAARSVHATIIDVIHARWPFTEDLALEWCDGSDGRTYYEFLRDAMRDHKLI